MKFQSFVSKSKDRVLSQGGHPTQRKKYSVDDNLIRLNDLELGREKCDQASIFSHLIDLNCRDSGAKIPVT